MLDFLIAIVLGLPILFLLLYVLPGAYDMYQNGNYHCWPGVARCQLCDKRIFAWQHHERRVFGVDGDNPDRLIVHVSGSCLVHKACKGEPVSHVTIRFGINPQPKTTRA